MSLTDFSPSPTLSLGRGGGSGKFEGRTLLKIIICIKSGTLLGNILEGSRPPPQKRPPGSPDIVLIIFRFSYLKKTKIT